jgi:excisionase family DNA binding protein
MTPQPQRRLLKTKEAAYHLGCSSGALRKLVHDEKMPVVRFGAGHEWRFDIRALDAFIDAHQQIGT